MSSALIAGAIVLVVLAGIAGLALVVRRRNRLPYDTSSGVSQTATHQYDVNPTNHRYDSPSGYGGPGF